MSSYHSGYSDAVLKLFSDLKGKRKLVDILNLLEDLTECYVKKNKIPIELLLLDLDTAMEEGQFKGFTKLQVTKIYKVVKKFSSVYTKIPKTSSDKKIVDKMKELLGYDGQADTRDTDEFLIQLRKKVSARVRSSKVKIEITEEYFDGFNAHYVRMFHGRKGEEFAMVVIQGKLVLYYSHLTKKLGDRRSSPVSFVKGAKGLDTLVDTFIEKDIAYLETENNK